MANTAIDGKTLQSEQAAGRALGWDGQSAQWITAHNSEVGFHNNPDELFQTGNGIRSITQMGVELTTAGYTGSFDRSTVINTYASTTGGQVLPYHPVASNGGGSNNGRGGTLTSPSGTSMMNPLGSTPVVGGVSIVGNPWQWLQQTTNVLGVRLPNWALAGSAGYLLLGQRRGRR